MITKPPFMLPHLLLHLQQFMPVCRVLTALSLLHPLSQITYSWKKYIMKKVFIICKKKKASWNLLPLCFSAFFFKAGGQTCLRCNIKCVRMTHIAAGELNKRSTVCDWQPVDLLFLCSWIPVWFTACHTRPHSWEDGSTCSDLSVAYSGLCTHTASQPAGPKPICMPTA